MKNKNKKPENIKYYNESKKKIKDILLKNLPGNVKIYLFGSGVTDYHSFNADIDVAILPEQDFNDNSIVKIKEIIEESSIPFKVDIVDLRNVDDNFKKIAFKKVKQWR